MLHIHEVEQKKVLVHQGAPIHFVDFPCSCVYSAILSMKDGRSVEVGTIGNEGMTSHNALLGGNVATVTQICQVPGIGLRMEINDFRSELESNPKFRTALSLYVQAYLAQIEQSVACNKLHSLEQRAARWLLMTHDRVRQDEFPLTQEFLAMMLGVQRPTVSLVARKFEQAGALAYNRGVMQILRRDVLEEASCECYAASRREFERLLGMRHG